MMMKTNSELSKFEFSSGWPSQPSLLQLRLKKPLRETFLPNVSQIWHILDDSWAELDLSSYESYISGMVENDFFFIGYKQMWISAVLWKPHDRVAV